MLGKSLCYELYFPHSGFDLISVDGDPPSLNL